MYFGRACICAFNMKFSLKEDTLFSQLYTDYIFPPNVSES